jgi:hypothetical protein
VGSGSEGVVTSPIQPDSPQKIVIDPQRESLRHASSGHLWTPRRRSKREIARR